MAKRVLDVGNCVPDHAAIRALVERNFDARVVQTHGPEDTLRELRDARYDLVLVTRKLDRDYSDGLDVIRRLAEQAAHRLTPGGWLTVEIGWDQGRTAPEVLARAGLADVVVRKDYSQNDRVVSGKRSAS